MKENLTCKVIHETKKYLVEYTSDEGGKPSIPREELDYEKNPTVSYKLKDGYEFIGWTCNKDVVLKNGASITAGGRIGKEEINTIKVQDDLKCDAKTKKIEEKLVKKNPVTKDSIKPYMMTAILTFLGITFIVLVIEDRKAKIE